MNQKPILPLAILMVVLILLQTACLCAGFRSDQSGIRLGPSSRSTTNWNGNFTQESTTKESVIDIKPDMTRMTLDADIELDSGTAVLTLTDPEGEMQLEKRLSGPTQLDEVYRFEPVTGEWTLKVILEDATGSYRVQWEARN